MKGLLRYKTVSLLLLIVFMMGYIVFNYNSQSYLTSKYEKQDKQENSYSYNAIIGIAPTIENFSVEYDYHDDVIDFVKQIKNTNSYLSVPDLTVLNNDSGDEFLADVCIGNVMPKYKMLFGELPTTEQLAKCKYVLIGRNKMRYSYIEDSKRYININGEKYEVAGCLSTGKSFYLDNKVVIVDNDYDDVFWQDINKYFIRGCFLISLESDKKNNVQNDVSFIEQIIEQNDKNIDETDMLYDIDVRMNASHVPEPVYRVLASVINIFCIVVTYALLYYWMMIRKKEFRTKLICGFSNVRIILSVLGEISITMIIAILLGNIFVIISNSLSKGYFHLDYEMAINLIYILVAYYFITMFFATIYLSVCLINKNKRSIAVL